MTLYLDSSVVLRTLLTRHRAPVRWPQWPGACTSELLRVECHRGIDHMRIVSHWTPEEVAAAVEDFRDRIEGVSMFPVTSDILERASRPFPRPIGTLDAIHLASALLLGERRGESVHFLTHDRQLGLTARASGLEASGFLEKG